MENCYWLICPNSVEVLKFSKKKNNKDNFFEYMFIDQGIVMGTYGEKPPLLKSRKEIKIEEARIYWQTLINEGWKPTDPKW